MAFAASMSRAMFLASFVAVSAAVCSQVLEDEAAERAAAAKSLPVFDSGDILELKLARAACSLLHA